MGLDDLEVDISTSVEIIDKLADIEFANKLYAALCNVWWYKTVNDTDADILVRKLKGNNLPWSISWRSAGSLVADLRNLHYNSPENYITFYSRGHEGNVDPEIDLMLRNLGWTRNL